MADLPKSCDNLPSREDNGPNFAEDDQTPPNEVRKANQSPIKTQQQNVIKEPIPSFAGVDFISQDAAARKSLQGKLAGALSENGVLKEQINNEQSQADQANKELESAKILELKSRVEEAEAQVKLKEAEN